MEEPNINSLENLFGDEDKKKTNPEKDLILADTIAKNHTSWTLSKKDEILRFCLRNKLSHSTDALLDSTPELFSKWLENDSEDQKDFQLLIRSVSEVPLLHLVNKLDGSSEFVEQASNKTFVLLTKRFDQTK